jgi:acyl-coenzyme A synthetase/AMP-(fatty) acid ligase
VLAETGTTQFASTPPYFFELLAAVRVEGADAPALPALRVLLATGTTIPKQLVTDVRHVLGVLLRALYGTTEIGLGTYVDPGR